MCGRRIDDLASVDIGLGDDVRRSELRCFAGDEVILAQRCGGADAGKEIGDADLIQRDIAGVFIVKV